MHYEWWDSGEREECPESLPSFIKPFVNKIGCVQGTNCLAAVIFSVSKNGQMIFNPWKILKDEQLYKEWKHLTYVKSRDARPVLDTESLLKAGAFLLRRKGTAEAY